MKSRASRAGKYHLDPDTKGIGVNRVRVEPGRLSTPPHSHGLSEEIFFVLGGSGLSWQDGAVCEVHAGDTLVHLADTEEHTLRGGPDGLDYIVFGTRHPVEYGWLPRSRALRLGYPWVEGRDDDPWDVEAEVGELEFAEPGERPPRGSGQEPELGSSEGNLGVTDYYHLRNIQSDTEMRSAIASTGNSRREPSSS